MWIFKDLKETKEMIASKTLEDMRAKFRKL